MDIETIEIEAEYSIQHWSNEGTSFVFPAKIDDDQMLDDANRALKLCQQRIKTIDTARKDITGPLLDSKRKIDERFKAPAKVWQEVKDVLVKLIKAYKTEKDAEAEAMRKEARRLAADYSVVSKAQADDFLDASSSMITKVDGRIIKDRWEVVIDDYDSIPREFLMIDTKKLTQLANAKQGQGAPAGTRFVKR